MNRRAFTMIELVIYFGLSTMVLGTIFAVFFSGQSNFEATSSSYLVSQDAEASLRWLKADLQEAALSSIRVYPNSSSPTSAPGLSMASPRNLDNEFQISKFGSPLWSTYVYYTLDDEGKLTRWMEEHEFNGVPKASTKKPETTEGRERERVVLRNLVQPGDELAELGTLSERGGFDFQFVRYTSDGEEVLTSLNPAQVTTVVDSGDAPEGNNTRLVALLLTVAMSNFRERNVSYVQLPIRVVPRH
jgi:type II secretory pathway pseudopilin PulG